MKPGLSWTWVWHHLFATDNLVHGRNISRHPTSILPALYNKRICSTRSVYEAAGYGNMYNVSSQKDRLCGVFPRIVRHSTTMEGASSGFTGFEVPMRTMLEMMRYECYRVFQVHQVDSPVSCSNNVSERWRIYASMWQVVCKFQLLFLQKVTKVRVLFHEKVRLDQFTAEWYKAGLAASLVNRDKCWDYFNALRKCGTRRNVTKNNIVIMKHFLEYLMSRATITDTRPSHVMCNHNRHKTIWCHVQT